MFGGVVAPGSTGRWRRAALQLGSVAVHVAAVAVLLHLWTRPVSQAPLGIPVRIVQPRARAAPAPPPPPPKAAPRAPARPSVVHRPQPLLNPTVISDVLPEPGPKEEPEAPTSDDPDQPGGVVGGREGGVVGGVPGVPEAAPLLPARPADLATVRAGIARTLAYPAEARRKGWGGRTVVAFTLLADGSIADLVVRQGSGHAVLDEAALDAIRRAAPFAPPGVDVLVVVPVAFAMR